MITREGKAVRLSDRFTGALLFLAIGGACCLGKISESRLTTPTSAIYTPQSAATVSRPNILWISAEDISPDLGCYGDAYARTPNLDRLATQGMRFTNSFATAPVCAP